MTEKKSRHQPDADRSIQYAPQPILLTAGVLLAFAWTAAWLFQLGESSVLAASLAIIVLTLMAFGIRTMFRKSDGTIASVQQYRPATEKTEVDRQTVRSTGHLFTEEPAASVNGKRWGLEVFATIDAQRFAAVCETWFSWAGFDTRSEAHRTNEGVDIWLHAPKVPGPVAIVRCKHWRDKPVGLQEMKDFLAVMAKFKAAHGTYTTTSTYTPEALQFAKEHGIDAVDGRGLLRKIQTRTRQSQQALLAIAYNSQS